MSEEADLLARVMLVLWNYREASRMLNYDCIEIGD